MRRSWTEEHLTEAVRQSHSFCEAIRKLGLRPVGGNYESIKKNIARMNLDTSHFNNDDMIAPLRKRHARVAISDDEAFRKDGTWIGSRLRKRVLKLGFIPYACALCGNPGTHCGKPLTLHLDHENGNHRDCRKENLRWLCPNCHTQTPTYARTTVQPAASV
jgi:5-methylcytosine-specific restriction endonuclease McrA